MILPQELKTMQTMNIFKPFLFFLVAFSASLSAQEVVWPGDVNNNGVVNQADLLFLGLGYGSMGPVRKTVDATWASQAVSNIWETSAAPGLNLVFADCNGDGIIDENDVQVIKDNFGRTHNDATLGPDEIPLAIAGINPAFAVSENADLAIFPNQKEVIIPINLGNATLPIDNLKGISFSIKVNGQAFDTAATKFTFNGWLPTDNAAIITNEDLSDSAKPKDFIVAYTKTNNQASNGSGLIGELILTPGFILEDDVPDFKISIDSVILIDETNNKTPVLGTDIVLNPVGFLDSTTIDTVICQGETVAFIDTIVLNDTIIYDTTSFKDTVLIAAGIYRDTIPNSVGGDSIIILNLTVLPNSEAIINDTICQGGIYLFAGDTLSQAGTYIEILPASNGCDSSTTLQLIVLDTLQTLLENTICQGDSYDFNGQILTEAGIYRDTLVAANGCDQYLVLTLTVNDTLQTVVDRTICQGDIFSFNEQNLSTQGTYRDTFVAANGCDQYVVLNLTVEDRFQTMLIESICQGEAYLFGNEARVASGVYEQVLLAANGCDSVITLTLTVNDTARTVINQTICENSTYNFAGQALTIAGTYYDTLSTVNSCDSIVMLNLKVADRYETELNESICTGGSFSFNGQNLSTAGVYQADFVAVNGCDSIVILNLAVYPTGFTAISEEICTGSTRLFNGQALTRAGVYLDTLATENGCDSMVELTLSIAPMLESSSELTICAGDTLEFYTFILTETNSYTAVVKTAEGCDSMVILNLLVLTDIETTTNVSICAQDSFQFGEQMLTESGTYTQNATSAAGCDSLTTLNLEVLATIKTGLDGVLCPQDSFQFGDQTLTEAGVYTQNLTSVDGCDSTVTLNLTMGVAGEGGCMSVSIEAELLEQIEIYPNPVRQSLFINSPTIQVLGIRLINLTGQVLSEQSFNKQNSPTQQEINMQDFVSGVYWVLIQTEYGLRQEKVVKF